MEFLEESLSFCDDTIFSWHGLEFSAEGNYRDTLWHSMPEACDTAFLLHLHVLPVSKDTTYATIHYGDEYLWEGELWGEENPLTHVHMAANGCDSLTTLQLTVDYSLTVEQMDLESGCSEDEQMTLHLQLSRLVDSVQITFSDNAKNAGFRDSIGVLLPETGIINIPLPDFLPLGQQSLTLTFYSDEPIPEACRRTEPQTLT